MNYMDLLLSTTIPSNLTETAAFARCSDLYAYINNHKPTKLYRFRNCSERHISAFYNDELWFSGANTMNDDYDARMYYNKKELMNWLEQQASTESILYMIKQLTEDNPIPSSVLQFLPQLPGFIQRLQSYSGEQLNEMTSIFVNVIRNDLDNQLLGSVETMQELKKLVCLSEAIDSGMMWGHYSDSSQGFALEYRFDNPYIDIKGSQALLFPVAYSNKRLDATEYAKYLFRCQELFKYAGNMDRSILLRIINSILICPDVFIGTKLALVKSAEWKPEKEWRLIYPEDIVCDHPHCCVTYKPSALYIGRKTSDINRRILIDIAREKGIPVYNMIIRESSKCYKLKAMRVKDD